MKRVLILLVALGMFVACAERKVATKQEEPVQPQEAAKEVVAPKEEVKAEPAEPAPPTETVKVEEVSKPVAVKAEDGKEVLKSTIHFDFDRYEIKNEYKPTLKKVADWLVKNPGVSVVIEGHCDERGTNEYNLGLGERRANATKSHLMTLGVPSARMKTVSYGEEKPVCTESVEGCWWKNRRSQFAAK